MNYKFELKLDNRGKINAEAVSRLLDEVVKVEDHASADLLNVLMQIDSTPMTSCSSELNEVVKQMLRILVTTGECYVLYSLEGCVYTVSRERRLLEPMIVGPYLLIGIEEDTRQYTCFWGEGYEPREPKPWASSSSSSLMVTTIQRQ